LGRPLALRSIRELSWQACRNTTDEQLSAGERAQSAVNVSLISHKSAAISKSANRHLTDHDFAR